MTRAPTAEVVVVGGGPAGTSTAITCALAGLDVTLLDASCPGPAGPGETLHPGVEVVLAQLGLGVELASAGFLRHPGHWVQWGGPRRFQAFGADDDGPWLGYQAPRERFDAMLLDRARAVGVEVRRPCRALDVLVEGGAVRGVLTSTGEVLAGMVVDASGRRAWLARRLGLPLTRVSPRLVAAYGHCLGRCPDRDLAPLLEADRHGWTWTARVGPATYAWVRLALGGDRPWGRRPPELAGLAAPTRPRGADVTWRLRTPAAGPGHLAVGDACALLDPAASHGVLRALTTGVVAGTTCASVLRGLVPADRAASAYQGWVETWFRRDVQQLDALYRVFPGWPSAAARRGPTRRQ